MAELVARRETLLFSGADLSREDYAHLDIRRTLRSLAFLPLENWRGAGWRGGNTCCFEEEVAVEEIAALARTC